MDLQQQPSRIRLLWSNGLPEDRVVPIVEPRVITPDRRQPERLVTFESTGETDFDGSVIFAEQIPHE